MHPASSPKAFGSSLSSQVLPKTATSTVLPLQTDLLGWRYIRTASCNILQQNTVLMMCQLLACDLHVLDLR